MATKQIWLNLPVKDVAKSIDFFSAIGFSFVTDRTTTQSACMLVGDNKFVVMLFIEEQFKSFVQNPMTNTSQSSEILISVDAESKSEVDAFSIKVKNAGGTVFSEPKENQGWMYGFAFADLDGHRWNVLYMDFSKIPT